MTLDDLMTIGRKLLEEIPRHRFARDARVALATGAAGDKTFPMDRRAEEIILSSLEALGEPLSIVSEERGVIEMRGGGDWVVVDPIDGSRNAVSGLPVFCASIAVASGGAIGDIYLSYVVNLVSGDEFWAQRGMGAFMNGVRIRTQRDDEMRVVLYEAQSPARDIPRILPALSLFFRTRCLGATAVDLAHLGAGSASAFVAPAPSRSFDFAGGWLVVGEAGGIVTDLSGEGMEGVQIGLGRSAPIAAAANGRIHEKLIDALNGSR